MIQQLVSLIKAPGLTALPGPVAIVILKGLGSIAQQRPLYLGRILPTLLSLASTVKQPQVLSIVALRVPVGPIPASRASSDICANPGALYHCNIMSSKIGAAGTSLAL